MIKSFSAMILAAGYGKRMLSLTNEIPKPLIKIRNKAIIEYIISLFKKFKISKIIIASGYKNKLIIGKSCPLYFHTSFLSSLGKKIPYDLEISPCRKEGA